MSGPDLSVLDAEPLDNGLEWAAEQTRRTQTTQEIPIVVLTPHDRLDS